jgi:RimJ/RimL family protein N-acetyltransferase
VRALQTDKCCWATPEMLQPPVTRRLLLRPLESTDAEAVYAYRADPQVSCYQIWEPASVEEIREFIVRMRKMQPLTPGQWFQFGIIRRDTGGLVGDCGVHARADDRRQVELGIALAPSSQRQGMAREAFSALLEFLFTQTETHRAFCSVDPRNRASLRLLEKIGMRQEACMVESLWVKGTWVDDVVFAILKKEWKGATEAQPPGN